MGWERLAPAMQRAVWDAGWPRLWPLQEEAIGAILGTQGHVLVAGDTASGKTEAAFLPVLSLPASPDGFTTLYVSPLRALLNDQYERIRALGAYAGVSAHLWHSDVPRARKAASAEHPSGVLLTTPESIEALCVHRALHLPAFFGSLRFVVIDELHAFLGTERGAQLHSLLERLDRYGGAPARRIGLSATVGDRAAAAAFLGEPCAICSGAGPRKGLRLHCRYVPEAGGPVEGGAGEALSPSGLGADLAAVTRGRKALIFCNTRARVEALTYDLARRAGDPAAYLPHHGSLHLSERGLAERSLRAGGACSIVCTSTLELGIDVGGVDLVAQVDCSHSVAGLRQRLSRSGRSPGRDRVGQLYATGEAQLVQSVAVVELLRSGFVEPPADAGTRYDVLWQQTLSEAVERGGLPRDEVRAPEDLVAHMLARGHLETARDGRLIPGVEGERLARRPDFCACFAADPAYEVAWGARVLGHLPPLPLYRTGTPLLFAGRPWTVVEVDHARQRIEVEPGAAGHPPVFASRGADVHPRVREEMRACLAGDARYPYLDEHGSRTMEALRRHFRRLGLGPRALPAVVALEHSEFHAFAGDRVANTLALLLQRESGRAWEVTAWGGVCTPEEWPPLDATLRRYGATPPKADALLSWLMELVPDHALRLPKFGRHLPVRLQREMHAAAVLDVPGALQRLADRT